MNYSFSSSLMDHSGNGFQQMENPIKLKVVTLQLALAQAAACPGRLDPSCLSIPS